MFTKKIKRQLRQFVKAYYAMPQRSANLHCRITERGNARAVIAAKAENGMIAICRSGMDCDCTRYSSVRIEPVPVSIVAWLKNEDEHNAYLDGPESMWIDPPSAHDNQNSHESRDLALEAYENGHPHFITY